MYSTLALGKEREIVKEETALRNIHVHVHVYNNSKANGVTQVNANGVTHVQVHVQ